MTVLAFFPKHDMKQSRCWFAGIFPKALSSRRKNGWPHQAALRRCAKGRTPANVRSLVCLPATAALSPCSFLVCLSACRQQIADTGEWGVHIFRKGETWGFVRAKTHGVSLSDTDRFCSCGQWTPQGISCFPLIAKTLRSSCLLYTSGAADETSTV